MNFAEVAVNTAVNQTFHYHIPERLQERVTWGSLVRVGFGTAMQPGIVVDLHNELPDELQDITTKPIIDVLHPEPAMTDEHIELAVWMSRAYLASPGACLWLMLPPGLVGRSSKRVHLIDAEAQGKNNTQQKILNALAEKSPRKISALRKVAGIKTVERVIRDLENEGYVEVESILSTPTAKRKTIRTVMRAIPEDEVLSALAKLEKSRSKRQPPIFAHIAKFDYPLDIPDVYATTDASSADLNALERKGLVHLGERLVFRDSLADKDYVPSQAFALTPEQQAVWDVIRTQINFQAQSKDASSESSNKEGTEQVDNIHTVVSEPPTPSPSPKSQGGEQNAEVVDGEKVPSPTPWRGDLGERVTLPFQKWASSYAPPKLYAKLKQRAREMRKSSTAAEDKLWQAVRNKQIGGIKFRRQHRIQYFIVDFYAPLINLVIEVDGDSHNQQVEYDEMRTAYLEYLGLTVLRFTNDDIFKHLDSVLEVISECIASKHDSIVTISEDPALALAEIREGTEQVDDMLTAAREQIPPPSTGEVSRQQRRGFLLHGVTGSGKTEIYLRAIAETIANGRQAIFLVPEIALTPQTIRRVAERFPEQVAVVHGSLSTGERFDTWRRARNGEIPVIVGTRSALFTPLPDVGLIILDEAHDSSYKQSPPINPPYYQARAVAEKLADLNDATLILGSATPDLETFYRAEKGDLQYVHLPSRIMGHRQRIQKQAKRSGVSLAYEVVGGDTMTIGLPPVTVVDMREELKAGNRSMFSHDLQVALRGVLDRNEQAILFLNRRGQASYVFCRDCGYVVECDNCDTPMTYHRHGEMMRCHHCNHQQVAPDSCPECSSERIRYFGAGTQQVEQAIYNNFPDAKLVRWDRDTADKPDLHEKILGRFVNGEANVMVGTQMVAKGLDLPLVTLVGVISADPGLALPDFRSRERAFQLLTQVAGRAGRGVLGGQVIIQTYQPQHPSIQAAATHDYEQFYELEIRARRELGYPPFRRLGRLLVQHSHPIEAQRQIEAASEQLEHFIEKHHLTDTHLIGPAPCFFSRIDKHYRWQILVRSSDPTRLLQHIQPRQGWYIDIDPVDIL